MWKTKLCLGTNAQFGIGIEEQVRLFQKAGFDAFFVDWEAGMDVGRLRALADETGMIFQSIHAPFGRMADLWEGGHRAEAAVAELIACLQDCAANRVPIMICHAFIGFERHCPNETGVEYFRKVVEEARALGVKLALENTEGEEYLAALMKAFWDEDCVGFCWDTGHELCYNRGQDMTALYGDKLCCTHLNDNLGIRDFEGRITWLDDLHLLPFDGVADWPGIVRRLNDHGFEDILTFELNTESKPGRRENDGYGRMVIEDYLAEVYKRACRVAALKQRDATGRPNGGRNV